MAKSLSHPPICHTTFSITEFLKDKFYARILNLLFIYIFLLIGAMRFLYTFYIVFRPFKLIFEPSCMALVKMKRNLYKLFKLLVAESKRLYRMKWYRFACASSILIYLITMFILLHNEERGFGSIDYIEIKEKNGSERQTRRDPYNVLLEKGAGCEIILLESLFQDETLDANKRKIDCPGPDWVECVGSKCFIKAEVLSKLNDVVCTYKDILYENDYNYSYGEPVRVTGDNKYTLERSDHVRIYCIAAEVNSSEASQYWRGCKGGVLPLMRTGAEQSHEPLSVLLLIFGSVSHNGFKQNMPRSYALLSEKAVIMNGYSAVGDRPASALFPILTGEAESQQTRPKRGHPTPEFIDDCKFIFEHLLDYGYRTAYFEDLYEIGTFQHRHHGFGAQPADHYLRPLLLECHKLNNNTDCAGDTPTYQMILNYTKQVLSQEENKFCVTFLKDPAVLSKADDSVMELLLTMIMDDLLKDTLVVVMGARGTRCSQSRKHSCCQDYQQKIEERLPFMAVMLPEKLKLRRPSALRALKHNKDVLTTHFDLHATLLDVLNLNKYANKYKVPESELPRSLSLLEKIPRTRTCSEAGVPPAWCPCSKWYNVSRSEDSYRLVGETLGAHVNLMVYEQYWSFCVF